MSQGVFEINYGSDLEFEIPWPDGAGGVVDLTDWTVGLINVSTAISGLSTATKSATPTDGKITVRIEWSADLVTNTAYDFRVQISKDGEEQATNLLRLIYR